MLRGHRSLLRRLGGPACCGLGALGGLLGPRGRIRRLSGG